MPKGRRLVIATGGEEDHALTMFDVSDLANGSAQFPLQFVIQTQCDLGDWHTDSRTDIPLYGPSIVRSPAVPSVVGNGGRGYSRSSDDNGTGGDDIKP